MNRDVGARLRQIVFLISSPVLAQPHQEEHAG